MTGRKLKLSIYLYNENMFAQDKISQCVCTSYKASKTIYLAVGFQNHGNIEFEMNDLPF